MGTCLSTLECHHAQPTDWSNRAYRDCKKAWVGPFEIYPRPSVDHLTDDRTFGGKEEKLEVMVLLINADDVNDSVVRNDAAAALDA